MAKQNYVITGDTRIKGALVARGTIVKLDPQNKEDLQTIGHLNHAGRILEATDDNIKRIKAEADLDAQKEARLRGETGEGKKASGKKSDSEEK